MTTKTEIPDEAAYAQPSWRSCVTSSFKAAIPIMLGYAAIGVPCGILCDSIGLNAVQVLLMSVLFYSGAGQFMIPNMYLAGNPILAIITSVSLVNTRQMLYAASFAPRCEGISRPLAFLFAATVTDESFGVSTTEFEKGRWSVRNAFILNLFSQASWTVFNIIGVVIGGLIDIPLSIAAFAMTSIFICLLFTQPVSVANIVAAVTAVMGVFVCKLIGLSGPAILLGALVGVAGGFIADALCRRMHSDSGPSFSMDEEPCDGLE